MRNVRYVVNAAVAVCGVLLSGSGAVAQESAAPTKTYDIAAFVWPSYHPDDRAKIFWPLGIGE